MKTNPANCDNTPNRRGFSLAEVLVAVAIIAVLTGIIVVGSRTMANSRKRTTAEQQLAMIAQAIDQYAAFWPKWKVGRTAVADKGWPDFIPGRLFAPSPYGPFTEVPRFNDHLTFDLAGSDSGVVAIYEQVDGIDHHVRDVVVYGVGLGDGRGDVLNGNICLAHCLTADSGKGPHVPADDRALLKDIQDPILEEAFRQVGYVVPNPLLPAYFGGSGANRAQVLVDPWGTPYRYFWVYRDPYAFEGYLPVTTADINNGNFRTAVGFVVESAGLDRKFGNLWQRTSDIVDLDISEAEDNLTIEP